MSDTDQPGVVVWVFPPNAHSIVDAVADLGKLEEIGQAFSGFQKYLYQAQVQAVP